VQHLTYLAVLAGCLAGTAPLEFLLRTGVYRRWRRLVAALFPAAMLGVGWDLYAVNRGHWSFDRHYLLGVCVGGLPIEELLFFLVIPTCAVLTLEAVRLRRPSWLIGDEPSNEPGDEPSDAGSDPR
jgi:lycopene cyclase domain-containing protein